MDDINNKVGPIKLLVARLEVAFEESPFSFVAYWEADNTAIGLKYKQVIFYLSYWENGAYSEINPSYYLEIEIEENENEYKIIKEVDNLNQDNVIDEVLAFIQLYESYTLAGKAIPFLRIQTFGE